MNCQHQPLPLFLVASKRTDVIHKRGQEIKKSLEWCHLVTSVCILRSLSKHWGTVLVSSTNHLCWKCNLNGYNGNSMVPLTRFFRVSQSPASQDSALPAQVEMSLSETSMDTELVEANDEEFKPVQCLPGFLLTSYMRWLHFSNQLQNRDSQQ